MKLAFSVCLEKIRLDFDHNRIAENVLGPFEATGESLEVFPRFRTDAVQRLEPHEALSRIVESIRLTSAEDGVDLEA